MFSKSTEYALRATIYIAKNSKNSKLLTIDEIAKGIDSPKAFTSKILQKLTVENGVIRSYKGPNGGFCFVKEAASYPIIHILKLMKEDSVLDKCIMGLTLCNEKNKCPLHQNYKLIRKEIKLLFESKNIEEMVVGKLKL